MTEKNYDLVVIGGGPGGYTGAIRAAKLGMKTALAEEWHLGGTCLNRGCIPTKALLHTAEIFKGRRDWESIGITADNVRLDENRLYERKEKVVQSLRNGVAGLIKANGVDLYPCHAKILSATEVYLGGEKVQTKYILIATGTVPSGYDSGRPLPGIEDVLTSDDVLEKPVESNGVIIIGGGVVAVEFASYFAAVDRPVTMVITGDRLLRKMSRGLSMQVGALLKSMGVKIITSAVITRLYKDGADIEVNNEPQSLKGAVIGLVGRNSNFKNLGLENIGLGGRKFIETDANMFTGVEGVYACGDITDGPQLAHYAAASAIVAVESMLGKAPSINLDVCPLTIYTSPEITVVGKSEEEVENAMVGRYQMGGNGKSMVEGVNRGYIKVIADENGVLSGAEVFAVRGTDIAGELALAIEKGMTVADAVRVIRPHPTIMEAIGESLEDIHGLATHIPPKIRK